MQNVGPEYAFLPSLQWSQEGQRQVYMVPIHLLSRFVESKVPKTTPISVARLANCLTEKHR